MTPQSSVAVARWGAARLSGSSYLRDKFGESRGAWLLPARPLHTLDVPGSLAVVWETAGLGKHSFVCLYIGGKWRTALLSLAGVAVELWSYMRRSKCLGTDMVRHMSRAVALECLQSSGPVGGGLSGTMNLASVHTLRTWRNWPSCAGVAAEL